VMAPTNTSLSPSPSSPVHHLQALDLRLVMTPLVPTTLRRTRGMVSVLEHGAPAWAGAWRGWRRRQACGGTYRRAWCAGNAGAFMLHALQTKAGCHDSAYLTTVPLPYLRRIANAALHFWHGAETARVAPAHCVRACFIHPPSSCLRYHLPVTLAGAAIILLWFVTTPSHALRLPTACLPTLHFTTTDIM